ncbi:MAG: acyl-CoA dehydrogenase family protein, partial [Nitrososphaerota archaeon]|nr:acyl-CoA dehydrogenase family protein [Nitrososphaerota archaeon]
MVFPFKGLSDYEIKFKPEHEMFRQMVKEFAEKEIAPRVTEIEEHNEVPQDLVNKMLAQGFQGVSIPQEYGGQGGDQVMLAIFSEEVAKVSPAIVTLMGANGLFVFPVLLFGSEEQK